MTIDFDRIETMITDVMERITYSHVHTFARGEYSKIEDAVDTAFMVLSYAFPEVECMEDTVTRRCATSAICEALEAITEFRAVNPGVAFTAVLKNNLCVESVMDDIINMNEE